MTAQRLVVLDAGWGDIELERRAAEAFGIEVIEVPPGSDPVEAAGDAAGVLVRYLPLDAETIERTEWQVIGRYGVGVDNVDLVAASACGIAVINVPDYCVEEVATHAAALVLAQWRKLDRSRRLIEEGRWDAWQELQPMRPLSVCTLGLVGVGRIGARTAQYLRPFFKQIIAYDPVAPVLPDGIRGVDLIDVLRTSDVISLHCPLTEETRHLIYRQTLAEMKPDALLVNVSRGGLIDIDALLEALERGRPGGAALDVLPDEPTLPGDPILNSPNLIMTNHVAWLSDAALPRLRSTLAERCASYLVGQDGVSIVNRQELSGVR